MAVGVENSNIEHHKIAHQRTPHAKSKLGKAFEGFMSAHTRISRAKAIGKARKKPVAKIKKNKKK